MILLDATVLPFGRMLVHDDLSIEEVLYLPTTEQTEIDILAAQLKHKMNHWDPIGQVFTAACASAFGLLPEDIVIHEEVLQDIAPEPLMEADQEDIP